MTDIIAKRDPNRCPSHPGEAIADILLDLDVSKAEVARRLGISRQHLYDVIEGNKAVSPSLAVRLGKLLGGGAGIWIRMQAAYDTWHAERKVDVSQIEPLKVA